MRLRWRRPSSPEDRFEAWIAQRHQGNVLEGNTVAIGPCPDEAFLRNLAGKSSQIKLSDPRVEHAASCSICMRKLLVLRQESHSRRRTLALPVAIASCFLIAVTFVLLARQGANKRQETNVAAITSSVNLFDAGTFRGEQPNELQSVSLPPTLAKVTIVLPHYSESGRYAVAVTRDRTGGNLLAQGSAVANTIGDHQEITVYLDLRKAQPGSYFLSTTHDKEQASYYYPLQVR